MSVNATNGGRVSDLTRSELVSSAIRRGQAAMLRAQMQLATGQTLDAPSQDPVLAARIIDLVGLQGRLGQHQTNANYAKDFLASADSALGEATDLLRQADELALSSASSTTSAAERAGNARLLDSIIDQLTRLANRQWQGRYLFDGAAGGGDPFTSLGGMVQYGGGGDPVRLPVDPNWQVELAMDGATVFGGRSDPVGAAGDLDPAMTATTLLSDLRGAAGHGVAPGAIVFDDGVNPATTIDLSGAATVGDVIDLFNAAAPGGATMSLAAGGDRLVVTTAVIGADIGVTESGSGTAARDLGLLASGAGATLTGGDVDPLLTARTAVGSLLAGAGFDQAHGITITNGSLSATIDLSAASTVQDVLNAINGAGVGARAAVGADGRSLAVVNVLSGGELKIVEDGGQAATDLGIRTFHGGLRLADLNGGRGVDAVAGLDDLRITQRDGTTIDVNLDGALTIDDVIAAINGDAENTGDLVASIGTGGGIVLTDASADAGSDLSVEALNLSAAPGQLGLVASVANPGATLTGADVSGARAGGVFSYLTGLRDALDGSDTAEITRCGGLLEGAIDDLVETRAAVGAQAGEVDSQIERLADDVLATDTLLSNARDLDLTDAVLQFQQLQGQLQASLLAAGQMLNMSLLDFLR